MSALALRNFLNLERTVASDTIIRACVSFYLKDGKESRHFYTEPLPVTLTLDLDEIHAELYSNVLLSQLDRYICAELTRLARKTLNGSEPETTQLSFPFS